MRRSSIRSWHTAIFLVASVWSCLWVATPLLAQTPAPGTQSEAAQVDRRFIDFKKALQQRLEARIDIIVSWMRSDAGDHYSALVASVREPLRERLKLFQSQ